MSLPYWIKSSLNTKLSIALVIIVILSGVGMLLSTQFWMARYHDESTQKLNTNIAMYINDEYQLLSLQKHSVNLPAIKQLSQQAMVINPMVEAYLLDTQGRIIAHDEAINVQRERIDLEPIKQFIAQAELPIYGQDPKSRNSTSVFSATELRIDGTLQGYLYVVLGSSRYENVQGLIAKSHSASMLFANIALISLLAILMGLLIFKMILNRLHNLTQRISNFTRAHSNQATPQPLPETIQNTDEIRLLDDTFTDMSQKISQQLQLLKEADDTRKELISNVSHDLRTPLASLQGYLETLIIKNNLTAQERRTYLNTAMSSSQRLSKLVSELFELSKLEAPTTSLSIETFSITELAYDTMQEFELELQRKEICWEVHSSPENLSVTADISLIQRVFENLIRNAIAYTPVGGRISIAIDEPQDNERIKLRVSDTGVGISAQDLPHIFNRFYANPDKSRVATESNGLGLAIVKRILDLHDSSIKVKSEPNQGTQFEFELAAAA